MRVHRSIPASIRLVISTIAVVVAALLQHPAGAQDAPASPSPSPSPFDHAYLLIGTWSCHSGAGSHGTWTYVRDPDGSLSMTNHFRTPEGRAGSWKDTYRFDAAAGTWTWNSTYREEPTLHEGGTAPPWTGDTWSFTGKMDDNPGLRPGSIALPAQPIHAPLHMTYAFLADSSFVRRFEIFRDGSWSTVSASTCMLTSRPT